MIGTTSPNAPNTIIPAPTTGRLIRCHKGRLSCTGFRSARCIAIGCFVDRNFVLDQSTCGYRQGIFARTFMYCGGSMSDYKFDVKSAASRTANQAAQQSERKTAGGHSQYVDRNHEEINW